MAGRALDIAQVLPAGLGVVERRGEWRRFAANQRALAGAVVLAALAASALLAPVLAPYDPAEQRGGDRKCHQKCGNKSCSSHKCGLPDEFAYHEAPGKKVDKEILRGARPQHDLAAQRV